MPLFSIVTPTYNRANLLPQMINGVIQQHFIDWELIIVDDGSTDSTPDIVSHYKDDIRIKYIRKTNSGAAHSRNVGVGTASGLFLVFLDSDDQVYPDWLQTVAQAITDNTGIISVGAIRRFSNGETSHEQPFFFKIYEDGYYVKFTAGSLFVRKNIFLSAGGYDDKLLSSHHTDLGYRLLIYREKKPYEIIAINKCLIQINVHEGCRIRTDWNRVKDGTYAFIKKHEIVLKKFMPKTLSNYYAVIAHAHSKLGNRRASIKFTLMAIGCRPFWLKNYFRVVKYLIN